MLRILMIGAPLLMMPLFWLALQFELTARMTRWMVSENRPVEMLTFLFGAVGGIGGLIFARRLRAAGAHGLVVAFYGLFALLLGVRPRAVHEWYLAVYVDAVEWVEAPNTIGMSQFADGGLMGSKPYIASGKYIDKMSNYCKGCRFDPGVSTGPKACPFTTLYWDFLDRHRERFAGHPRLVMQVRNLDRLKPDAIAAIRGEAALLRKRLA